MPREKLSRCATFARTARFRFRAGHCDGQTVECTYHGWRFDAHTGQCREIPSITADSKLQCDRIYAGSFPCEERDGYVWVYLANPEGRAVDRAAIPPASRVAEIQRALPHRASHRRSRMQHGHGHRWPDGPGARSVRAPIVVVAQPAQHPRKAEDIRADSQGFRMSSHAPSANSGPYKLLRFYGDEVTTQIDFVLPNMRTEQVRCGNIGSPIAPR